MNKTRYFFVWGVWLLMLLIALSFVFIYGRNIPLEEDWNMVAGLTGNQGDMSAWLWDQNNEHRIPFPKFLLFLLLKATGGDFRSGMVLNILACAFTAFLFIKVMYKLRGGKMHYADAFFPIAFLHIGNWENFYWSWQFTLILATLITCVFISIVIQYKKLLTLKQAILVSVLMMLLPLSGANGLVYLLPVVPCVAYEGFLHLRNREPGANRLTGMILIGAIFITALFIWFYFNDYYVPWWNPPNPGIKPTVKTIFKFISMGFGGPTIDNWRLFSVISVGLICITFVLLIVKLTKVRGIEFRRAFAIFMFLGGYLGFALLMGYGRAGWVPTFGLPIRYVLLSLPGLIICYCAWAIYGPGLAKNLIPLGLFIIMLVMILPNTKRGFQWRDWYLEGTNRVMNHINQGLYHNEIIKRNQIFLLHSNRKRLSDGMIFLKKEKIGPFQYVKDSISVNAPLLATPPAQ